MDFPKAFVRRSFTPPGAPLAALASPGAWPGVGLRVASPASPDFYRKATAQEIGFSRTEF